MAKSNKIEWLYENVQAIRAAWRIQQGYPEKGDTEAVTKFHGWGNLKDVNALHWNEQLRGYHVEGVEKLLTSGEDADTWFADLTVLCVSIKTICNGDPARQKAMVRGIQEATLTSFYTPTPITKAIGAAVSHTFDVFGIKSAMVLDPSAGAGAFLNIIAADKLQHPQYAIEKDPLTAMILQAQHPEAKVINKGFEDSAQDIPYGEFDVVASNIPFGQVRVSDPKFAAQSGAHRTATAKLHAYYFLKGLEACKNGGILAFITTRGIADSQDNQYVRDYLCKHGNLLAAYRLPDNMFVTSAGIEVGSDLLIWQRDDNKSTYLTIPEQMFKDSIDKEILNEIIPSTNRLLSQRQQALYTDFKVCKNQFGKMTVRYNWSDTIDNLAQELQRRLTRDMELYFRKTTWLIGNNEVLSSQSGTESFAPFTTATVPDASPSRYLTTPTKRAGNLAALEKARQARAAQVVATEQMRQPLADIIDAVTVLNSYERANRRPNDELRRVLNDRYDSWLQQFGPFHLCADRLKTLPDWQMAMTLEIEDNTAKGKYRKADVFTKPVTFTYIDPNHKFEPREAMCIVLNELGYIDMPRLEELTKLTEPDIYQALKGELFLMPSDGKEVWMHKSLVINGDVIRKRKKCDAWLKNNSTTVPAASPAGSATVTDASPSVILKYVTDTRDALLAATPKTIPYGNGNDGINLQLGARWLPTKYTERFANYLLRTKDNGIKIHYGETADRIIATYEGNWKGSGNTYNVGTYGCEVRNRCRYEGLEVLNFALKDDCPDVTYKVCDRTFVDADATRILQKAVARIGQEFERFMYSKHITADERREIETIYNEKFNCYVRAEFDGSFMTLPGCHLENMGIAAPYKSQLDCAWMFMQNGGGVAWHQVGAGKTLIMCITAREMSRLGLCKKPLIIAMKANVGQIADTFRKLYPDARLLYPGKDDFTKDNRTAFFNKIAQNDWDCIIMTHEQFYDIPNSLEMEAELIEQEIEDVRQSEKFLSDVKDTNARRAAAGQKMRLANLESKLNDLRKKISERSADVIDFERMGIGHVFIDECHRFKNLQFSTRQSRVAGLGDPDGSLRSWHLLVAIRTIQKRTGRDLGASFLSGTVVANALTELYVLFKYLTPRELRRKGIYCFDAWANTFIKKSREYELDITGQLRMKERLRQYINVPEMSLALRRITDYRTAAMMNLDIPNANVIFKESDPTAQQLDMMQRICQYAGDRNWSNLQLPYPEPCDKNGNGKNTSHMFIVTDLAKKCSLDTRLLDEARFTDDPGNKSSVCAATIADYYRRFDEHKGTQFVFCDQATPTKGKTKKKSNWNVYADIKRKLVSQYGIPADEIAFIHDYNSEAQKMRLFSELNSGKVRVVFGSTEKLGTGVNAQQRVVAIHHLDIPWRPADMEQRNGRGVRKGNEVKVWGNNTVDVIIYGTKRTLDPYKFGKLTYKEAFINQINDDKNVARSISDRDSFEGDGKEVFSYAEMQAALSGNPDLIEIAKLDRQIDNLINDRAAHQRSIDDARLRLTEAKDKLTKKQRDLARFEVDLKAFTVQCPQSGTEGLILPAAKDQSLKEQGRYLFDLYSRHHHAQTVIGSVCGFPLAIRTTSTAEGAPVNEYVITLPSGLTYHLCNSRGTSHEAAVAALSASAVIEHLNALIARNKSDQLSLTHDIESATSDTRATWDGDTELADLTSRRDAINDRINADLAARERQQQDAAIAAAERQAATDRSSLTSGSRH